MKRFLILLILISGCVTKPQGSFTAHVPPGEGRVDERLVFPYGHYTHEVKLTILNGKREFTFQGIVETRPERILLTALSPFQTTLMRIEEDRRTGEVKLDCYMNEMKPYQAQFNGYYQMVRQVLIMDRQAADDTGKRKFDLSAAGGRAEGEFSNYDAAIPRKIEITDPRFLLSIKVTEIAL